MKIAAGGLKLLAKLKDILRSIEAIVEKVKAAAAGAGRTVLCKLTGGCFIAGTLVAMGDGSFVPIEDIAAGDVVRCEVPAATPGLSGEEFDGALSSFPNCPAALSEFRLE